MCIIDPEYLFEEDLQKIINKYKIKNVHRIGMYEGERMEWNFHALIANDRMPEVCTEEQVCDAECRLCIHVISTKAKTA